MCVRPKYFLITLEFHTPVLLCVSCFLGVSLCLWSLLCQQRLLNKNMLGLGGHRANISLAGMCAAISCLKDKPAAKCVLDGMEP